jgi:hypothetical protein
MRPAIRRPFSPPEVLLGRPCRIRPARHPCCSASRNNSWWCRCHNSSSVKLISLCLLCWTRVGLLATSKVADASEGLRQRMQLLLELWSKVELTRFAYPLSEQTYLQLIHHGVWKRYAPKFGCSILHSPGPMALEPPRLTSSSNAGPHEHPGCRGRQVLLGSQRKASYTLGMVLQR